MAVSVSLTCSVCGVGFVAKRRDALTCSKACRNRRAVQQKAEQRGAAQVAPIASPESPADSVLTTFARRGVVAAVRTELERLGLLDTVEGDLALALARGIDSPMDGVSAKATASRELRALMAEMRRSVGASSDGLAGIEAGAETKLKLVR